MGPERATLRLHTTMKYTTLSKWLARRDEELLLPDRPPLKGMPKIHTTPGLDLNFGTLTDLG